MIHFYRGFSNNQNLLDIVSKLRNKTALSLNMCRKAALESNFDFNLALEILSKSANASIKSDAATVISNFGIEGLIGVLGSPKRKCIIELRCDSDFVSRNPEFIGLANNIMQSILSTDVDSSPSDYLSKSFSDETIQEIISYYRTKFRENIGMESFRLIETDTAKHQAVGHYVHQRLGNDTGKIGSLVKVGSESIAESNILEEIGNILSRQTVALGDSEVNVARLLNSEYLFAPLGTVRKFIEQYEEKLNSKITVLDIAYIKIK